MSKAESVPYTTDTKVPCPYDDCNGTMVFQEESGLWYYCSACDLELTYPFKTDEDRELYQEVYAGLGNERSRTKTWPSDRKRGRK